VLFSALGWTKNSVPTVFIQILSRYVVLYMIFPYVEENHFSVFLACICWAWTEVVRFTFYTLKELNMGQATNTFAGIVGYFRYNSFIVCYPVGITGELMAYYMAWENFSRLPKD